MTHLIPISFAFAIAITLSCAGHSRAEDETPDIPPREKYDPVYELNYTTEQLTAFLLHRLDKTTSEGTKERHTIILVQLVALQAFVDHMKEQVLTEADAKAVEEAARNYRLKAKQSKTKI